jgi:hypothetical protein
MDEWFDIDTCNRGIKPTNHRVSETESEAGASIQLGDPIIEKAKKSTQKARTRMMQKYLKRQDIQHFEVGHIVSLKIPREERTSTDNRRLFGRILEPLGPHNNCLRLTWVLMQPGSLYSGTGTIPKSRYRKSVPFMRYTLPLMLDMLVRSCPDQLS